MTEQWTRWEPIQGLSGKYYVESISDTMNGFDLLLSDAKDETKRVRIRFEESVDSYKRTDETYKLQLIHNLNEQYGTNFYANWTFFKVSNSSYVQLISEESYNIADSRPLIHFSFLAVDSVVDIIADYEPTIQLIE